MLSLVTMQRVLIRLKVNGVDRTKFVDSQKKFYDQDNCHDRPQDLLQFDTLTLQLRQQFQWQL